MCGLITESLFFFYVYIEHYILYLKKSDFKAVLVLGTWFSLSDVRIFI